MVDLLQEVDEMMRQERLERLWRENGNYILGFVVAVIVMTGAVSAYKSWRYEVRAEQTATLIEAMEKKDFFKNARDVATELSGGLQGVALLTAAGKAAEAKDLDLARRYYSDIASGKSGAGELYGLGVIMSARLAEPQEKTSHLPALQKLAGDQSSPWRYHAFIEAAVIEASYNRDFERARTYLANIIGAPGAEAALPGSLIERAHALDHVYRLQQPKAGTKQEG